MIPFFQFHIPDPYFFYSDHKKILIFIFFATHDLKVLLTKHMDSEWEPREGLEFDTYDEAWSFWERYGRKMGFGVRKIFANKSKLNSAIITSGRFSCSKEGHRKKDKRDHLVKKHRAETRTDCPARMGVKLNPNTGKYYVNDFVREHTHELHLVECVHMLPSYRKIGDAQAQGVELGANAGLTQKDSFALLSELAGGRENLGFTRLDQNNYLRTRRQNSIAYGEVGSLLGYFKKKALEDPSFFYSVQLDNEEQITNIFWADAKMRIDYDIFGDVVTFDTTFSTNKACRPLGVFVGCNHHKGIVIFGAALLYDETIASFQWLFETFLEAHKGKRPKTIFTDQDGRMATALENVIPDTRHGLCTFHIMQNAIKKLGHLMKDGSCFLTDLNKLVYEYDDKLKFEEEWENVVSFYQIQQSKWINDIYEVKEKWSKAYMKTAVTMGMRSTQLSESLNADLKRYLTPNLDVASFFRQFERVVKERRYNEKHVEYESREKMPRLKVKTLPLLNQAAKVYTPVIFELFQEEWEKSLMVVAKQCNVSDIEREYSVRSYDKEAEYIVSCNLNDQIVMCSCKNFETSGILCSHALKVLDVVDIKVIPELYILKRWTRKARESALNEVQTSTENKANLDVTDRYMELCPDLIKIASKAADFHEGYVYMKGVIEECNKRLDDLRDQHYSYDIQGRQEIDDFDTYISKDEVLGRAKGIKKKDGQKGRKRHKSWVEKIQEKSRRKNARKSTDENSMSRRKKKEPPKDHMPVQANDSDCAQGQFDVSHLSFTQLLEFGLPYSQGSYNDVFKL